MKNRLLLLFFLCIKFGVVAQTQFAVGGMHGGLYVDIIPDTLLNPISSHNGGVDDNYYYLDINQDGTNDIKIDANFGISPGHVNESVGVSSLDSSTKFSYWKTDSSFYNASCGGPGYTTTGSILTQYILG